MHRWFDSGLGRLGALPSAFAHHDKALTVLQDAAGVPGVPNSRLEILMTIYCAGSSLEFLVAAEQDGWRLGHRTRGNAGVACWRR